MEDPSKKFTEFVDELEVPKDSNTWNITGKSAADVIAIFKSMVNNREGRYGYSKGKVFTFKIGNPPTISFKLRANPTSNQPGNGKITRNGMGLTYESITEELNALYRDSTNSFARDIRDVFEDNSKLLGCRNVVIQDVYILLLFEIGRRLVKDGKNPTGVKKALDNLPISGAITKIVKLFKEEKCSFEDFFKIEGKFHCFTGELKKREGAIRNLELNEKYEDIKALFYGEEDKKSSEDDASEGEDSSEDAEVRKISKDKGSTVQRVLPWPTNKVSYLKTTSVGCKPNAYSLPRRKFAMAGSVDPSKRFLEELQEIPAKHWNITSMNAATVISVLKSIVNDREKFKDGAKFTFNIKGDEETILFTLEASPTDKQPGNGIIRRRNPRGGEDIHRSYDKELIDVLKQQYRCTEKFAQHIRCVFKNNSELFKCGNEIIQDVYILLLFEIGRRLVDDENVLEEHLTDKQAYDSLPVSEAITRIVKLFEAKKCSFEDFFDKEGEFHCFSDEAGNRRFSGRPSTKREDAIKKLLQVNEKYEDIKALFYGEKDKQSSEDAVTEGEESSEDTASEGYEASEDA